MERSAGIVGMVAVAAIVMVGALNSPGGAVQTPAPRTPSARGAYRADADSVGHALGAPAFPAGAQRRAILDRDWQEGIEERCAVPSPFAAPGLRPVAC